MYVVEVVVPFYVFVVVIVVVVVDESESVFGTFLPGHWIRVDEIAIVRTVFVSE